VRLGAPYDAEPVMSRWVALLRGINVGRAKQVDMADLRRVFEDLGATDVRTHLRSGNVVFTAEPAPSEADVERAIVEATGVSCSVLVRSAEELAAVVAANPLADIAEDPSKLLVAFLSEAPDDELARAIAASVQPPTQAALVGRAAYFWCPEGVAEATLGAASWQKRGITATSRNWRTVTRLLELADPSAVRARSEQPP
jgi:uncharacterized protein (DUF1697 family)